jgi:hypothetical protein
MRTQHREALGFPNGAESGSRKTNWSNMVLVRVLVNEYVTTLHT